MTRSATLRREVTISLSPADLAEAFTELDDDAQAKFFVEVARIIHTWPDLIARHLQVGAIGNHLRTCSCGSFAARDLIRELAAAVGDE